MLKYVFMFTAVVGLGVAAYWLMNEPLPTEVSKPVAEATYVNADGDRIKVAAPLPGATVGPTFMLLGQARGSWYFEASFPVEVIDSSGRQLLVMPVPAQGDWMTTEFVPFSASITVPGYTGPATLILRNDNASGLPEHDRSVSIPIVIE